MIPGMNPKKMQQMMRQMGIKQSELGAKRVEIFLGDKKMVFENPSVQQVDMMGQVTFQLTGNFHEEALDTTPQISEEDIQTVAQQTGKSLEEAQKAIQEAKGDLAEAILSLSQ